MVLAYQPQQPASPVLGKRKRNPNIYYNAEDYFSSLLLPDDIIDDDFADAQEADQELPGSNCNAINNNNNKNGNAVNDNDDQDENDEEYHSSQYDPAPRKRRRTIPKHTPTNKKKAKKTTEKFFPLLALPFELRIEIYNHCLVTPSELTLMTKRVTRRRTAQRGFLEPLGNRSWRLKRTDDRKAILQSRTEYRARVSQNSITPALLAVNKQIHDEAMGILYNQPIILQNCSGLFTLLAGMSTATRARVRDVTIREWSEGGALGAQVGAAFALLADCVNLRRLFFDCEMWWYRGASRGAEDLYRDGHWFFEAFGAHAGRRRDAVLDVLVFSEKNWKNCWARGAQGTSEEKERILRNRLGGLLKNAGPPKKKKGRKTGKASR